MISACSSKEPVNKEKFISDSEYAFELLTKAFDEKRQLTTDENNEIIRYEIYYGSEETDYALTNDEKMLSSYILLMNLDLEGLSRKTSVIGESLDYEESFKLNAEDAKTTIKDIRLSK